MNRRTVTIVYRFLPQYRVDFFHRLREDLAAHSVNLQLIYGRDEAGRRDDERDIDWAIPVRNRTLRLRGREYHWQPLPRSPLAADLVILMQETKLLSNFAILARSLFTAQRLAFWGHGVNFQDRPDSLANRFKRKYSSAVHWWFAYTEPVADLVAGMGFPRDRITVVQNAIDTAGLIRASRRLGEDDLRRKRQELGLGSGPVAIYCGGMYAEKRIEFLIEACRRIRARLPQFEAIFIGTGPDRHLIERFAAEASWVHFVGPKFGDDRVAYFRLADVFLMPGLVGLAVLDAFALGVPLVTTEYPFHSPEIAYIENGHNGIISANDIDSYTQAAIEVLESAKLRETLQQGCEQAAQRYTLEAMVGNFSAGVLQALE